MAVFPPIHHSAPHPRCLLIASFLFSEDSGSWFSFSALKSLSSLSRLLSDVREPLSLRHPRHLFSDLFTCTCSLLPTPIHVSHRLPQPSVDLVINRNCPLPKSGSLFILSVSPNKTLTMSEPVFSLPACQSPQLQRKAQNQADWSHVNFTFTKPPWVLSTAYYPSVILQEAGTSSLHENGFLPSCSLNLTFSLPHHSQ